RIITLLSSPLPIPCLPPSKALLLRLASEWFFSSISAQSSCALVEISSVYFPLGFSSVRLHSVRETLNDCHFERSEKSMVLIAKDPSLCSE
ncbi:MAG: hypothetical protein Q8M57_00405, partial [Nitrosomonas sp.]|nr:hypothetical protein [Nitrosomonas sp.]